MSAPFVNPYETKDVVASTLNNLDKQTQDLISYLDGFFSSEVTKDRELVFDNCVVEVLKPFDVATSSGAFWDKGTTYYFQPIAERLREISQELQARLVSTDVTQNLKDGINQLFTQTLNSSRTQVVNGGTNQFANNWQYELWYNSTNPNDPVNKFDTPAEINDFFKAIGTSAFFLADAASDEDTATQPMSSSASGLKIDVKLEGIADLLDDGDNYYNDSPVTDYLGSGQGVHSTARQEEFYLIGNNRVPVFGKFESKPVLPNAPTAAQIEQYNKEYYDFVNQRIDPKSIYWNDGTKTSEEIFLGMVAIILTGQKRVEPVIPPNAANPTDTANALRAANEQMMNNALTALEQQTYDYLISSKAWYDSAPPRNVNSAVSPAPPSFLLSKMNAAGTIDYSNYDGNYGTFDPSSTDNLASLIASGTGLSTAQVIDTLNNWTNAAYQANVNKITAYYTQSYLNASIASSFPQEDSSLATKNFFLHNAFSNKEPGDNPYLTSDKVLKFDQVLTDIPADYLRAPENTPVTGISTQMMQLMDMFLENFDISSARYVEDKRTLVDLFTGKLVNAAGDNKELTKLLFQNISDAADDIAAQSKNILTRGVADAVENQFMLDLFNQTALRKEDYGLSPNPADPTQSFLPSYWADKKDKFFPAHYYFDPVSAYAPTDLDKANHNFDPTKNGLPTDFPIMDLRDFNEFFKAIKNELNNLLGSGYITGYPTWADTGFSGTVADVFGSMSNETDLARALQLRDSVTTILDNMEDRIGRVSIDIPKIPRPQTVTVNKPTGIDLLGNITTTPELITLNSSVTGYGDQPSLKLVTHFLQMHRDTSGIEDANRPAASKINDQISYLINMFDDYSKFSQNSAFEAVYPGQVFEADKQNYTILNAKKPEPGPDGSMPEEKDVPKPLMSALSSSLVIGQIGQVITTKVNDIVQENDAVYVKGIKRAGGTNLATGLADTNIGAIDLTNTQLGGSKETQIYLNNILKQIANISATGTVSIDISAIGSQISSQVEAGVKSLITDTDNNNYRMVFIDDTTIDALNTLLTSLNSFNPTGALGDLKTKLANANLNGLKSSAYPSPASSAPGYLHYNALSPAQQALIEEIKNGTLTTASIQALIPSNTVPLQIPDATLNTLQTLAGDIESALNAALAEDPPRDINLTTDPVLNAIKAAKIDFAALTAADSGNEVDYNIILDAAVFDPIAVPIAPHTAPIAGHPNETAIRNARTSLLSGLLATPNDTKNIGGVSLSNLTKEIAGNPNPNNPYVHLFSPVSYTDIDPANATPAFPNSLTGIANASSFIDQLSNIETYLTDLEAALNDAINEKPPRDIDVNDDPILKLSQLADLDLEELKKNDNDVWKPPNNTTSLQFAAIIESDKAAGGPLGVSPIDDDIRAARTKLLNFFLDAKNLDPTDPIDGNFKLTQITGHARYKNLISPVTYDYPNTSNLDDTNGVATLSFTASIDPSRADSYTLREILGADLDMTDGVQTGNVTNSLEDLESRMRANPGTEFTATNRRLYVRKMQHFNILFNTLSGGTSTNQPLKSFLEKVPPGTTITVDTHNHPRVSFTSLQTAADPGVPKTLGQYIEAIAADPLITGSAAFASIVNQVQTLGPIIDNINALDVTLGSDLKKPKAGPESNVYSTLHLLTQIENQRDDKDMSLGLLEIFNTRKIKVEGTGVQTLEQRPAAEINLEEGEYQFHGYAANINFLKPANVPTISGAGIPPDPNQRWNLEQAILNKGGTLPPFTNLADTRDFLAAANEVYKDMKSSKS